MMTRALQWILVAVTAAAAVGYGVATLLPAQYEARATLLWVASPPGGDPAGAAVAAARHVAAPLSVGTYVDVATSEPVVARAFGPLVDEEGVSDAAIVRRFASSVSVEVVDEDRSALIHVRVRADEPQAAAERAGMLADALLAWDAQRARDEARSARDAVVRQIDELTRELNEVPFLQAQALGMIIEERRGDVAQLGALEAAATSLLTVVHRPSPPERPANRSPLTVAVVAGALAGLAALGAVLLVSAMRDETGVG